MLFPADVENLARATLDAARARSWRIATAESCTGGLVAAALTEIAGSSDVVDRGFVTYSNAAKTALLGVPAELIERFGAVSEETVRAMVEGALAAAGVELAVAITGVAGPGGGSVDKPVGLVWFGMARRGAETEAREMRFGDLGRGEVRLAALRTALEMLHAAAR